MTQQIEDEFQYRGENFTLLACSSGEPFSTRQFGIRPNMASTGCWRGCLSTYGLHDDRLVVAELRFELVEDEIDYVRVPGPEINGVKPIEKVDRIDWFNNNYLGLNYPVDYDGGLIIGNGYHEKYSSDLDHITLWKYREVVELQFGHGHLSQVTDLSTLMMQIQQFADERAERLKVFMKDVAPARKKAGSNEERETIARNYFRRDPILKMNTDDFAREKLTGLIDPAYLKK